MNVISGPFSVGVDIAGEHAPHLADNPAILCVDRFGELHRVNEVAAAAAGLSPITS
jgi:hypothetical protein